MQTLITDISFNKKKVPDNIYLQMTEEEYITMII